MKYLSLAIILLSTFHIHASEQQSKLAAVLGRVGFSRSSVFGQDNKGEYKQAKQLDEDMFDDEDEEEESEETATKSKPCKMFKDKRNRNGQKVYTDEYAEKLRNCSRSPFTNKQWVYATHRAFTLQGPVNSSVNITGPAKEAAVEPLAVFGPPHKDGYMRQIAAIHTFGTTDQYGEGHVQFGKSKFLNPRYKFEVAEPTGK